MLIITIFYLILSCAITTRRDTTIFFNRFLSITLFNVIILACLSIIFNKGIGLYSNFFFISTMNIVFNIFILFLSLIILNLSSFYPRNITKRLSNILGILRIDINNLDEQLKIIEYPLIILFIVTGAIFLMNSNDIVSVFLSIELQSYGLYLLCTLFRNSELSTSAGLTYFLLGSLSSCFILLGTGILYSNTGVTSLDYYYIINNLSDIKYNTINNNINDYVNYSLLIMSIGFLFKISAAPFHFWSPDVYDAIPTITTTFVAIVTKISIFLFIFELVNYTSNTSMYDVNWTMSLLFSSFLSLIVGTVMGLNQYRIKRLFAYSTISHLGFILLALSINTVESIQAFIFYIIQYSLSNLNAFILLLSLGYSLIIFTSKNKEFHKLTDINNSPLQLISQLKGFFGINPLLSISLAITIYSLIGIPPLIGFFGKQIVLSSALDQDFVYITLIAILTSVISAVYYLNVIRHIFFEKSDYDTQFRIKWISIIQLNKDSKYFNDIYLSGSLTLPISILTLIITLFMINPQEWLNLSNLLSTIVFT